MKKFVSLLLLSVGVLNNNESTFALAQSDNEADNQENPEPIEED